MLNEDEFGEWDTDFLDQLIKVEELAISSTAKSSGDPSHSHPFPHSTASSPLPRLTRHLQQPLHSALPSSSTADSYSPPRELSQRAPTALDYSHHTPDTLAKFAAPSFRNSSVDKDNEIERLKSELGNVSKQLNDLQKECLQLKKERDEKEDQLKFVFSKNEKKKIDRNCPKSRDFVRQYAGSALECENDFQEHQNRVSPKDDNGSGINVDMSTYKSIGIQTNKDNDDCSEDSHDDHPAYLDLSRNLLSVWGSPFDQNLGRNVISKLFVACQTDFHLLFGSMGINISSKVLMEALADGRSSDAVLQYHINHLQTTEATRVSSLYFVLVKIMDGTYLMDALFEPLLDLCSLGNIVVVHSSLHILRIFLQHLLTFERNSGRDNFLVEGLGSRNDIVSCGFGGREDGNLNDISRDEISHAGCSQVPMKFSDLKILLKKGHQNHCSPIVHHVDWVSLFEVMHQIFMRITVECVRIEAISIMNLILVRSNAYFEREKFFQITVDSLSQMLKKEAGLGVKRLAVKLLYLVLNCPKVLASFCCGCKDGDSDDSFSTSNFQRFSFILQSLADCFSCNGRGVQELRLCKNTVLVLAFLASSGKTGFEILVSHKLSRGDNFLMLILQVLASEIDSEAGVASEPPDIFRERTFLIREILILLNRLVCSPSYSATVLQSLTNSRSMASLTVDVANRLSRKWKINGQHENMVRHTRATEIVDLARVFQKRVLTYLGDL